jgi:DHA3 family macrolide efflux protein-like MFS transporter
METASQPERHWIVSFFTIWTGQAFSLIGSTAAQFALVWYLTQTTGSATVLALATFFAIVPGIILGPIAGAYVDRWNRKWVMVVADGVAALVALLLAYLFWQDLIQVWQIYLLSVIRSIAGTFHFPAFQASTSLMVPKEHLTRVAGVNQALQGGLQIIGPPLGALLVSFLAMNQIMLIDVFTALLAIIPLLFVLVPQPVRIAQPAGQTQSIWRDVKEGFAYIWNWKGVLFLLGMAMVINFMLTPAFSLLPLVATRHFGSSAIQLGVMQASFSLGLLLGGLALSVWGGFKKRMVTSLLGLVLMGLSTVGFGLVPAWGWGLAVFLLAIIGIMNAMTNAPLFAMLQAVVAPDMQGRVFTVIGSLSGLMAPIGLAIAGPLSDAIGVRVWYVIGGLACVLMAGVAVSVPAVMNMEEDAVARNAAIAAAVES